MFQVLCHMAKAHNQHMQTGKRLAAKQPGTGTCERHSHLEVDDKEQVREEPDQVQARLLGLGAAARAGRAEQLLRAPRQPPQREQQHRAAHWQGGSNGLVAGGQAGQGRARRVAAQRPPHVVRHQLLPLRPETAPT